MCKDRLIADCISSSAKAGAQISRKRTSRPEIYHSWSVTKQLYVTRILLAPMNIGTYRIVLNFRGSLISRISRISSIHENISTKVLVCDAHFSHSDCMQECRWTTSWGYKLPNQQLGTLSKQALLR